MAKKFDLHLSAYSISPETVRRVESLGFKRDEFANNKRCDTTVYHGTYRGDRQLPDDNLWDELQQIFVEDRQFVGGLEEEEFDPDETVRLTGSTQMADAPLEAISIELAQAGTYKACDIHINVSLGASTQEAIDVVESLGLASFDKPQADGIHRVFSATTESVEAGRVLFGVLKERLGMIPGLVGKIKYEKTTRFLRIPDSAPVLPLTKDVDVNAWAAKNKLRSSTQFRI